ncbi:MAG: methionyl-tRNA formyltransferase [Cumulibacter sp.]
MRVLFAGTPEVAVPSLNALVASAHDVVAVLTRPDTRSGRGRKVHRSEVGQRADELGIDLLQPASLRDPAVAEQLSALELDVAAIVAYGGLVPASTLRIPRHGWVNLHFSLLPRWRGAAPVQHAIAAGDERIGACTFQLEAGLDTGPIFDELGFDTPPRATAGELLGRLAMDGAPMLRKTLDDIAAGTSFARPQPAEGVMLAPKILVEDVHVDFSRTALEVDRLVRSAAPAPGAWCMIAGQRLRLSVLEAIDEQVPAGELVVTKREVIVGCAEGAVRLGEVQPQGKRPMSAADFARGARLASGMSVGETRG